MPIVHFSSHRHNETYHCYRPAGQAQIGDDKTDSRKQLAGMVLDLGDDPSRLRPAPRLVREAIVAHQGLVAGPSGGPEQVAFGSRLLCDIAASDVAAYQQKRLKENAQGKTANIELGVFRQFMKANECWVHLAAKVKALPVRKGLGRALTPEEERLLLTPDAPHRILPVTPLPRGP